MSIRAAIELEPHLELLARLRRANVRAELFIQVDKYSTFDVRLTAPRDPGIPIHHSALRAIIDMAQEAGFSATLHPVGWRFERKERP